MAALARGAKSGTSSRGEGSEDRKSTELAPENRLRPQLSWARAHSNTLICLLLIAASVIVGLVQVPKHTSVSPIDEYVYIDYFAKVPTQFVVARGEPTGEYARKYLACHGNRMVTTYPAAMCNADQTVSTDYPMAGRTSADIYPPFYFAATWLAAQPLTWLGVDLVDAGRLVGSLWLALGAIGLFAALRRLRVTPLPATGVALLMIGSLPAYWSNTYISTDATSLAAGAWLLYVGVRVSRGEIRSSWFVLVSVLATIFKLQNFLAVVTVGLVLLVMAWRRGVRGDDSASPKIRTWLLDTRTKAVAGAVVFSILSQVIWFAVRAAIAVDEPVDQGISQQFTLIDLARELFKYLPNLANGATAPEALGGAAIGIAGIGTLAVVGGVVGLAAAGPPRSFERTLAVSIIVSASAGAVAFALASVVMFGQYVDLVARYGMSLFPAALACAALLFKDFPGAKWLWIAIGSVCFVASLTIPG